MSGTKSDYWQPWYEGFQRPHSITRQSGSDLAEIFSIIRKHHAWTVLVDADRLLIARSKTTHKVTAYIRTDLLA